MFRFFPNFLDLSGLDLSGLDIDLSGVGKDIDFSDIMAKAPTPDFSGIFDGLELTPEQTSLTVH